MTIRKLTAADEALYLEMVDAFYHSEAVLSPVPRIYHENTFRELIRSDEYLECFLFENSGQPAGYALLSKSFSPEAGGPVVWLEELYVCEAYRRKGFAKAFLSYLEETLPAKRYRLEVEPDNQKAMAIYEKAGYRLLPYVQMKKDL